jgi:hypothetical protein
VVSQSTLCPEAISSSDVRHGVAERDARSTRSIGEQEDLARRMRPWRSRRSSGAVEGAGDVVGAGDDLENSHAAAALSADRDVDGEDPGEEARPPETARSRRHIGRLSGGVVRGVGEVERELQLGRWDCRGRNDARAEVVVTCNHTVVARHVKAQWGHPSTWGAAATQPMAHGRAH